MTSVELWWGYEPDSVRIPCSVFTSVELSRAERSVQEPCDVFRKLSHLHVLFPAPFLPDGRLLNPAHSKLAPPWSFVMSSDPHPVNFPDILSRAQGHPAAFPGQALRSTQTSKTVSLSWKGFGMEEQMSPRAASFVWNELWELLRLKASCFWGQREALLEGKCVASSVASSVALEEFETL